MTNADDDTRLEDRPEDERGRADDPGRQRAGRGRRRRRLRLGREQPRRHGLEDRPAARTAAVAARSRSATGPSGVAYGDRRRLGGELERPDGGPDRPAHGTRRAARFRSGSGADAIAVGDGAGLGDERVGGSVTRIDPRTGSVMQPINVGNGPTRSPSAPGRSGSRTASTGPSRGSIRRRTGQVRRSRSATARAASRRAGGSVWVSNELARHALADRPGSEQVVQTVTIGNRPAGGRRWPRNAIYVAVRASGLAHRGGTLTPLRSSRHRFDSIDPAVAFDDVLETLMPDQRRADGLQARRRQRRHAARARPRDLASRRPPTAAGRTRSSFARASTTRPGRSCGPPTSAARSSARSPSTGGEHASSYFGGIVGATACVKTPGAAISRRGSSPTRPRTPSPST